MFKTLTTVRRNLIRFTLDGQFHQASAGISVAAALLTVIRVSRRSVVSGRARGPYCMMGTCFDCLVCIDGEPNQQACMVTLREGMKIETQPGIRDLDTGTTADMD